jgi:CDP-glycerol glycerophosphotransferase (TagB/SpsB family)
MDFQNKSWRVFAESEWHKSQFEKYGKMKGQNVVVSGYPKLDEYLTENINMQNTNFLNKLINKKRIIWAPHWSIWDEHINNSTFDKLYKEFLEYAKKNSSIDFIFKPHQRLKYQCVTCGFMSKDEIDEYYEEWNKLSNAVFYNDANYFDMFKTSDALITDCGSFLAEYLPTKKPILLLLSENPIGYNEIGNRIIENYYKANNFNDVIKFIDQVVLGENDYLKNERLKSLQYVTINKNGAGKYIEKYLERQLTSEDKA